MTLVIADAPELSVGFIGARTQWIIILNTLSL